jgi:acetylornithine deacetylase
MRFDPVALTTELVSIDSVNPELVPGGKGEGAIAEYVRSWLTAAGLEVRVDDQIADRPSVIGIVRGTGDGPRLLLCGHTDTVGVDNMPDPFAARHEDGRLYGRGVADMKGGLAALMVAAATAVEDKLSGDVIFAAVCDEEHGSRGMESIVRQVDADAAIVGEATGLDVAVMHKGFAWFDVTVKGRAAHGGRPLLGVDAIAASGVVLTAISEWDGRLASSDHPVLGRASVHVGTITGGQDAASYPAECSFTVERRTLPGETVDQACRELGAVIATATERRPDLDVETLLVQHREPLSVPEGDPFVKLVRDVAGAERGTPVETIGLLGWTDAALAADAGMSSVLFGPIGGAHHEPSEWVDVESIRTCASVYAEVARRYCGREVA